MMIRTVLSVVCGCFGSIAVWAGPFSVVDRRNGTFDVLREGRPVASCSVKRGACDEADVKSSVVTLPTGTRVWNRWSESRDRRFRLEVAEREDGAVEVTMSGEADADSDCRQRWLELRIPAAVLATGEVRAIRGSTNRDSSNTACVGRPVDGGADYRWLAVGGLTYDLCPLGVANLASDGPCSVDGLWEATQQPNGDVVFVGGADITKRYGGWVAAKAVIRVGTFADYDRLHASRSFQYYEQLGTSRLYAFGAPRTGPDFADGNHPYTAMRANGWVTNDGAAWQYYGGNAVHVGAPQGAYYSCVSGRGPAGFRISGLADGYYIVTVTAGNYTGVPNRFSLSVDGASLAKDIVVPTRRAKAFSRVVHIANGETVIGFDGDYLVSAIGLQALLMDGEDFSIARTFWLTDGFEPTHVYRNEDDRVKRPFAIAAEEYELPVPGEEAAGQRKPVPRPVELPARRSESFAWMDNPRIYPLFFNWSNFSEVEDLGRFSSVLDKELAGKNVNLAIVSGFLSRHTYPAHEDRTVRAIGDIVDTFHRRGIRVIDHHDITLCWNEGSGFRVLAERLDEMARTVTTGLPSFHFCISNAKHNETQFAYLRRLIEEAGVDGFQLDELRYWRGTCACAACREKFHRETGFWLPMDECSPHWRDLSSPVYKAWNDWKIASVANWDVEARRRLKDLKEDLVLCEYTTDDGFVHTHSKGLCQDLIELSARAINFPGAEVMSRNPFQSHRSIVPMRKLFNSLSFFADAPVYGWYYGMDERTFYFSWCLANLCGQSALLIDEDVPRTAAVPDYLAFGASDRNINRAGAEPVAEVAILFSRPSRDWNPTVKFHPEALGIAQELECLHVPYVFIPDEAMTVEQLSRYKVLFLSAAECLSDTEVTACKEFAAKGGTVHMSVRSGICDEQGNRRAAWPFEGMIGSVGRGRILFDPSFGAFRRQMPETTPSRAFAPGDYDDDPAFVAAFRDRLRAVVGDASFWTVEAPDSVYVQPWREQNGDLVIHLLNATGARRLSAGEHPPVGTPVFTPVNEVIRLTLPAERGTEIIVTSPDFPERQRLPLERRSDGRVTVVLPSGTLKTYSLLRFGN